MPDELYIAVRPMLAVSGGRIILMSTPFEERPFFREWTEGGDSWERIMITARECPRISLNSLKKKLLWVIGGFGRNTFASSLRQWIRYCYDLVQAAIDDDIEPLFGGVESA